MTTSREFTEQEAEIIERATAIHHAYRPSPWHPIRRRRYDRNMTVERIARLVLLSMTGQAPPLSQIGVKFDKSDYPRPRGRWRH